MNRRVLVIGNCTLDISFPLARFPKPGETLLTDHQTRDVGGKGANQAVAAARSGVDVAFCSAVGSDEDGRMIRAHLEAQGVDVEHVRIVDAPTDVSIIYVTDGGENCIVSTHASAQAIREADVARSLAGVDGHDVVLMQGNLDRPLTEYALSEARGRGALTVLNPAPIHYRFDELWPIVDCAVLNEVEVEVLAGSKDIGIGARRLLDRGVRDVVITLGAAGALWVSAAGTEEFPAEPAQAVDTTGAGDVFCGILAAGLARALPLGVAIRAGGAAATLSVSRAGTQAAFPSREELLDLWAVEPYPREIEGV